MPKIKNKSKIKKKESIAKRFLKHPIIVNSLIVFVTILLFFILFEVVLRLFYHQGDIFYREDKLLGWSYPPGKEGYFASDQKEFFSKIEINSKGFRDEEFSKDKSSDELRIVLLGDSQAASFEVEIEERFDTIIEDKLSKNLNRDVEIYNFGVQGYATDQQYLLLRENAIEYKPDIVFLLLHVNDFQDNLMEISSNNKKPFFDRDLNLIEAQKGSGKDRFVGFLKGVIRNNLQIYKFFGVRINRLLILQRQDNLATDNNDKFLGTYESYKVSPDPRQLEAEEHTLKILEDMNGYLDERGIEFYVLLHDISGEEANLNKSSAIKYVLRVLEGHEIDFDRALDNVEEELKVKNVNTIDLRDGFREYYSQNNEITTFDKDTHWAKKGHEVAGNYLTEVLSEEIKILN